MAELSDRVGEVIEVGRDEVLVKVANIFNSDTVKLIEVKT